MWAAVVVLVGTLAFSAGCDPTLQATIENGLITSSASFMSTLLQAGVQVATQAVQQQTSNSAASTSSTGTTASP
jgi:hypothetical protein